MMKKLLLFAAIAMVGMGLYAEVYEAEKASELYRVYSEKYRDKAPDMADARAAFNKYVDESEINTENAHSCYHQLKTLIPRMLVKEKIGKPTVEQLDTRIEAAWKAEYDPNDQLILLKAELYSRYKHPEAVEALPDSASRFGWLVHQAFQGSRRYEEALAYAVKHERWQNAMTSAVSLKDKAKIFEYGKKTFLNTFITSPATATNLLTEMLKPDYTGIVEKADIAEFLKDVSERYPAPNANVEDWKGFMGFIGYRYKSITGNDLFKK